MNLSSSEHLKISQTICILSPELFDQLMFALYPPERSRANKEASRPEHCQALLNWAESREDLGIREVEKQLSIILSRQAGIAREFCIVGISQSGSPTLPDPQVCIQLLREKTDDLSMDVTFYERDDKGGISLVLSVLPTGLNKLRELYCNCESKPLGFYAIEQLQTVEYTAIARKARLIEFLKLRGRFHSLESRINLNRVRLYAQELADRLRLIKSVPASNIDFIDRQDLIAEGEFISTLRRARDFAYNIDELFSRYRTGLTSEDYDILMHGRDRSKYLADTIGRLHTLVDVHNIYLSREPISAYKLVSQASFEHIKSCAYMFVRNLDHTVDFNFAGADLTGANLSRVNLKGLDLTGADMTRANIEETAINTFL